MRIAIIPFVAVLACTGCQTRFTQDEKILAWNGVLVQGSHVSVTHANPGVYPSETLAYANSDLKRKIREITDDFQSACFLVPMTGGYDITILSRKRLTEEQSNIMHDYVQDALDKAWKETEIYRKKNEN